MSAVEEQPSDIVRATFRGRAWTIALMTSAVALVAFFLLFVFPLLNATLHTDPASDAIATLKLVFAGCAIAGIVPALFMVATGWKVRRHSQFPLPGAWVWRDTPVKRGKSAARIAWLCIVAGIVSALLCVGLVLYVLFVFDSLNTTPALPPGVVILNNKTINKP